MIIIGERISTDTPEIRQAVISRDSKVIQKAAIEQVEAGADMLDILVGPDVDDSLNVMLWLIECVQDAVNVPLSLDNSNYNIIAKGLEAVKRPACINSTTAEPDKLSKYMKLAKETGSAIIGLTIDNHGIPNSAEGRMALALQIIEAALMNDISMNRLFLDPVLLPIKVAQAQIQDVLDVISQIKLISDEPPHITIGLSNLCDDGEQQDRLARRPEKTLLHRTLLTMAVGAGMDACLMDPTDEEVMNTVIAAEVLKNQSVYSPSFIKAFHLSRDGILKEGRSLW